MMANGKKSALLPDVYRIQTVRKSNGGGVATLRFDLVYRDKPDTLDNDNNWAENNPPISSFSYERYELYEYFTGLAGEQAGMYVFYDAQDNLIATLDKRYVDCSTEALPFGS